MRRRRVPGGFGVAFLCVSQILLAVCLALFVWLARLSAVIAPPNEITAHHDKAIPYAQETAGQVLNGTVAVDAARMFTMTSYAGVRYTFAKAGAPITHTAGISPGCPISVYYGGLLGTGGLCAKAQVRQVLVYAANTQTRQAHRLLDSMSQKEKVGQMFFVRCPKEGAAAAVKQYHFGGLILFGRDFANKNKDQVIAALQSDQQAARIPLLIGVDEEGGTVNRVSTYKAFRATPFRSGQDLYAEGGWPLIQSDTKEKAELLRSLGINVNLAPVCDISTDPSDFMYARSFGKDTALSSRYVQTVVQTMRENGLGSVLKHFPGYNGNKDTHTGGSYDDRSLETFFQHDFLPFKAGIGAGADAVLICHNVVAGMDAKAPASLSGRVQAILRRDLGFPGVIMTDDLSMAAITQFCGTEQAAVLAVQAGNDLLCSTDFAEQIAAVRQALKSGKLDAGVIDQAVMRILCWKSNLALIP